MALSCRRTCMLAVISADPDSPPARRSAARVFRYPSSSDSTLEIAGIWSMTKSVIEVVVNEAKTGYPAMMGASTEEDGPGDAGAARSADGSTFALARPLPAALLCHRCVAADLPFALTSELEEAPGLIGQERAVEAISLAMRMRRKGYNVYALGPSGTGRHSHIEALLRTQAESEPPARLVLCQQFRRSAKAAPAAAAIGSRCRACRGHETPRRGTARRTTGGI